jgi:hypothetical protein
MISAYAHCIQALPRFHVRHSGIWRSLRHGILTVALGFSALLGGSIAHEAGAKPAENLTVQLDEVMAGAKMCTQHFSRFERTEGIPQYLLAAISTTETGRWHPALEMRLPWPWTINSQGKGHYFKTKEEAVQFAQKLWAQGVRSMDVGCMQVNLKHHPKAFNSLQQAFDPAYNVRYAASFLRDNYQQAGSWKRAVAHYHSRTPSRGNAYMGRVFYDWYTILSKLRATGRDYVDLDERALRYIRAHANAPASQRVGGGGGTETRVTRGRQPVRMNSISVTSSDGSVQKSSVKVRGVQVTRAVAAPRKVVAEPVAEALTKEAAKGSKTLTLAKNESHAATGSMGVIRLSETKAAVAKPASEAPAKTGSDKIFVFQD